MSGPTLSPQTLGAELTPEQIGIGMRISVHPHADDFERIIVDAIKHTSEVLRPHGLTEGLDIQTGEVSTYVGVKTGDAAQKLAAYAATLIHSASVASERRHLTSHILLSRGCPGGAACELVPGELPAEKRVFLDKSGIPAAASWSLYPLTDGNLPHMDPIMEAIQEVKDSGLEVTEDHFATTVRGDLSCVLTVIFNAWAKVGEHVPHVVSHVSLSLDSPSAQNSGDAA
ncbi:MAG TPA: Ykof family thiamine-binding protein [Enteractinococcus helveticum]|uniref:Ykof family thiamine-binding protein n=1 Tax=Enteractinococcus helveticum TaxID=1837282 RepID=A0A921FPQ5_9MICC|nr:YkoF family thiamine/hydroxymethylpyrimidine-binding protein [Enteractinococcus helveticum]HJF15494.1 Ykof family thiamine-binding protein [Enteractinococcus helveticum]